MRIEGTVNNPRAALYPKYNLVIVFIIPASFFGKIHKFLKLMQVVPTEYRYISKEVLPTNQFSVSEYYSPINQFDRTWPGWFYI